MKWFINMKIGTKLIVGFLIVAIIAGVVGVIGITNINTISNNSMQLYTQNTLGLDYMGNASVYFQRIRFNSVKMNLVEDQSDIEACVQGIADYEAIAETILNNYEAGIVADEDRTIFNDLKKNFEEFKILTNKAAELAKAGNREESKDMILNDVTAIGNKLQINFDNAFNYNETSSEAKYKSNTELQDKAAMIMLIAIAAGVFAAILLGVALSGIISKPMKKMVAAADRLASGNVDITLDINSKDETGILAKSLGAVVMAIQALIADTNMLVEAAKAGQLATRADETKHEGDYRKVVNGVNDTLDAIMQPLNAASIQLEKTANGDDLEEMDVELYKGDFKIIITNLNGVRESLYAMLGDSMMLADAAVEGKLSARADLTKHKGGYQKLIEGFNNTLDSVINPVNEAAMVLAEMSKGNLNIKMEGDYKGDHNIIKYALNDTINAIKGYIDEIAQTLGRMSMGDLTAEITSDYRGDFLELKDSINSIAASLNEVLGEINTAADQVAAGAGQVSNGNQAISQGAAEQASSIEELSASITQIAEQTEQNAKNSNKSNEMAMEVKTAAVTGNGQMKNMLVSMDEINESSRNISRIIKVIDDIAFQTNILALNAAVEAARAGVHGKGFAVVAEEVRNLAARSANAAKETTELIEGSIKKVGVGTNIAQDTADALNKIVEGVEKTVVLGKEIAVASVEQAEGIAQVNQGIEQMSRVVQTNSATAQEGAAASEELSGQASVLKDKIGQFKLKSTSGIIKLQDQDESIKAVDHEILFDEGMQGKY